MKLFRIALFLLAFSILPSASYASSICPTLTSGSIGNAYKTAINNNSGVTNIACNTVITINANGILTFSVTNGNPYDGNDDNYVGVINNYGLGVSSLTLTGSNIFGFDGDGIDAYGIAGNSSDKTGYGGGGAFFTNYTANMGTVNFIGSLAANGGTGYFSLEQAPLGGTSIGGTITTTVTPEPNSLILLGTGVLGIAGSLRRRFLA